MEKDSKKGFTLTELTVVLVILGIIAAIAVPFALRYIKLAEFRKNEANAKTVYLAAESELTWYRTSGKWKEFRKEVIGKGERNDTFGGADAEKKGRIYAITLNSKSAAEASPSGELVRELMEGNTYDKEFLNAAITIEIDAETGQVYSAFYATHCDSLAYEGADDETVLNISAEGDNRAYENRRERLLGYYSAEDVTNVVDLKPVRLKVTTINLVNSETLSLNWSSNSRHDNLDVEFGIEFYEKTSKKKLFSTVVDRAELKEKGFGTESNTPVHLTVKDKDDKEIGEWAFPLTYQETGKGQNSRFSLILDGMMAADLMEDLKANETVSGTSPISTEYSTSITRFKDKITELASPQDIYAVVEVRPTYKNMDKDEREYRKSSPVTSNTENTMFAADTRMAGDKLEAKVSRFRHLSNIRYYDQGKDAEFTLTGRSMDWTSEGVGFFAAQTENKPDAGTPEEAAGTKRTLQWKSVKQEDSALDFPSVGLLSKKHTLDGGTTIVSNLRLGADSVPADAVMDKIYDKAAAGAGAAAQHYAEYLGLFCETEGTVQNLTLKDPELSLNAAEGDSAARFSRLTGAGILCGRNEGRLSNISVKAADKTKKTVDVRLADYPAAGASDPNSQKTAGIGGLAGIVAKREADGSLSAVDTVRAGDASDKTLLYKLQMEGSVSGTLPVPAAAGTEEEQHETADSCQYGIGGIFGYVSVDKGVRAGECQNHAKVEGNLFAGGIAGRIDGGYTSGANQVLPDVKDCSNDGLVRCTADSDNAGETLAGRYFGGITGYGSQVCIESSTSASGRSENYKYTYAEKDQLLGKYVGGIVGYGNDSQIAGCSTKKGGYILGSDHVGGIAGSLSSNAYDVIKGAGSVAATVNASYVIGNRYVGGIVGENGGTVESIVHKCINNGVAAGYEYYIGGIAGYNGEKGTLQDCASYLSDYDHSIFRMVRDDWQAMEGDCAGGLAGYNNGTIKLTEDSEGITVRSVSSIVAGKNFVGGMIGFNDTKGRLESANNYTLIGGQVEAAGSAAGGCIGLNASAHILEDELVMKPSSVKGNYYVGGCIGANVVALTKDTEMSKFRADNSLGSITGGVFAGGMIGYQRTYADSQLGGSLSILEHLAISEESAAPRAGSALGRALAEESSDKAAASRSLGAMLPKIGAGNIPTSVMESENNYSLTVSRDGNTADTLNTANNNIPIRTWLYSGGVIGYCEKDSKLILKNCKNVGNISQPGEAGTEGLAAGVSLKKYLTNEGMGQAAGEVEEDVQVSMVGGVISANGTQQVIDHCSNAGSMSGFVGLGGIVSFNSGGVFNCELSDNFGNAGLDYIGGIAGLNVNASYNGAGSTGTAEEYRYQDVKGTSWDYTSGTIARCSTDAGRNISGRSCVGGIAGYNLPGGILKENQNKANITAAGNYAGGIAGSNAGRISLSEDKGQESRMVSGRSGTGIGGIVGFNKSGGTVSVRPSGTAEEVVAVNSYVSITGQSRAGGIAGINAGKLEVDSAAASADPKYLTCEAKEVRALAGYAGGIAGETRGNIEWARNKSGSVTADYGPAGGITAVNAIADGTAVSLVSCQNLGDVNSDYGHAGGITAENYGTLRDCKVEGSGTKNTTIRSRGTDEIGAVCAVNNADASIEGCESGKGVILSGESSVIGGIAGRNLGIITRSSKTNNVGVMPQVNISAGRLTVGGVAGRNEKGTGQITQLQVFGLVFDGFSNYQYLGGISGENQSGSIIEACAFLKGMIRESGSAAGNCYGGIAGKNSGRLFNCEVQEITCEVQGIYTATSTSTAKEKEELASHIGGIAGKNEETGSIVECRLAGSSNTISAGSGMAGGIAGYNNGRIELSGDSIVEQIMQEAQSAGGSPQKVENVQQLIELASGMKLKADSQYVQWNDNNPHLENFNYANRGSGISKNRTLTLTMSVNGNVGGITAYNSPKGSVDHCATGNWYVSNKSNAIGVGTGGIIGMNESENDLSFLLNQAFVGREIAKDDTNRFAGGIIGNQNNTTASGWKLDSCVNYGTVYCLRTHYSGGILGQWTGTGGTIEDCHNYGNLQTTYQAGWVGAAAGIVAQLYHAYEGNEYNIVSCKNFGNVYGRTGESIQKCANDSAGILGNVTAYKTSNETSAQHYTIQVLDCVNGPGVEIYSGSMASGIVGFFSSDSFSSNDAKQIAVDTAKIKLRIEKCRNYASVLKGQQFISGIFGDRYGQTGAENTVLKDCYSVNRNKDNYVGGANIDFPIVSMKNTGNSQTDHMNDNLNKNTTKAIYNYFLNESLNDSFAFENGRSVSNRYISDQLSRVNTGRAYILSKDRKRYLIYLKPGDGTLWAGNLTISANNTVMFNNKEVGNVLFEIDGAEPYKDITSIVNTGSIFDKYVQKSYIYKETGGNTDKMPAPEAVVLEKDGGNVKITVTPAQNTQPFKYTAELYRSEENGADAVWEKVDKTLEFYTNEYSFSLPEEIRSLGGYLKVRVRAHSSDHTIEPSDERESDPLDLGRVLPAPEIRMELMSQGNPYRYRFTLVNKEEYADFKDESGNPLYQISVRFTDGTPEKIMTVDQDGNLSQNQYLQLLKGESLQQLIVQAKPSGTGQTGGRIVRESEQVPVQTYLPAYKPQISIADTGEKTVKPDVTVSGETLESLRITAALEGNGGNVTTPPIYRADLVGTWNPASGPRRANTVFASADILTAANGTVSAAFTNLPEYITEAEELKVRIWYAQSGLGPVYSYYPVESEGDANIYKLKELENQETGGTVTQVPVWEYSYSPVLEGNYFASCRWTSGELVTWLPRPNLMQADNSLTPEYDANGKLQYTFRWDEGIGEYTKGQSYIISLTGVSGDNRVSIVTNKEISDNKYTADAEEWTYEEVELTVTRKGDTSGTPRKIGLTAAETYQVKQRLPRPAQPMAENKNTDELVYTVEWSPVIPEIGDISQDRGCASYAIYVQPYGEDGKLTNPELKGEAAVSEKQPDGQYRKELDLSEYAGKRALIYIVAKPAAGDAYYVDSLNGITYELAIPDRIKEPDVTWTRDGWSYDRSDPVSAEEFEAADDLKAGRLKIKIKPTNNESIPPGDSSYLLKAYVFDSEENAKQAVADIQAGKMPNELAGLQTTCPVMTDGVLTPAVMEVNSDGTYSATLRGISAEYAGKWLLLYTRISAGGGNVSSNWAANPFIWRLPYVKLPKPEVTVNNREQKIKVQAGTSPDILQEAEWTASQTTLQWDCEELADSYYLTLSPREAGKESQIFRIVETEDLQAALTGGKKITVYQKSTDDQGNEIWKPIEAAETNTGPGGSTEPPEEAYTHQAFELTDYQMEHTGSYTVAEIPYHYKVKLNARLETEWSSEKEGFIYHLILPDADSLTTENGTAVTDSGLRITSKAEISADVAANDPETGAESDAYLRSEEQEIIF